MKAESQAESKAGELDSEDLTRFEAEIPILFHSIVFRATDCLCLEFHTLDTTKL